MLKDRPAMTEYVQRGDPVYNWAVRQFAGGAVGVPILWQSDFGDYSDEFNAYHSAPDEKEKGYIALRRSVPTGPRKGQLVSGDELWSGFVYEVFNISHTREFRAQDKAAIEGKRTREEYITEGAQIEFKAVVETAAFYHRFWEPLIRKRHLPCDSSEWFADAPVTYEEWIGQFTDTSAYPYSFWGGYYDDEIVPYLKAVEASQK